MEINHNTAEMVEIFPRYITKNGKRIYPKNAQTFHFWVPAVREIEGQTSLFDGETKDNDPKQPK